MSDSQPKIVNSTEAERDRDTGNRNTGYGSRERESGYGSRETGYGSSDRDSGYGLRDRDPGYNGDRDTGNRWRDRDYPPNRDRNISLSQLENFSSFHHRAMFVFV